LLFSQIQLVPLQRGDPRGDHCGGARARVAAAEPAGKAAESSGDDAGGGEVRGEAPRVPAAPRRRRGGALKVESS
jgi:hypothetical protein